MQESRPVVTVLVAAVLGLAAAGITSVARRTLDDQQAASPSRIVRDGDLLAIDESMLQIAAATGGDFTFWSPGEFAASDLRVPPPGESVLLAYGELTGEGRAFSFAVDGVTGRLDVFAGAQRLDGVHVRRPSGASLRESDPDVDLQTFERMRIASIDRPAAGEWRIELAGRGSFSLSVRSSKGTGLPHGDPTLEPIQLVGVELVELRGRPGHRGLFPRRDPVAPGERHPFELTLGGSFASAEASLVGLDGRPMGQASIVDVDREGDSWATIRGECVVPDAPFRFLVHGIDATGASYQRASDPTVVPVSEGEPDRGR